MSIITLSCLVAGEKPYDNAFVVETDTMKLVSFFRDTIKEKIDDKRNLKRPVETKEVHCTATYGRKSEKFLWAVTRGQITLSALKTRLQTWFTFPDGTENKHIVINRESGKERIRLVDEDLACIIWSQGFKVDLPIIVDTCVKDTPDDIRDQVIDEFLRLHKTSQHITSANEATHCEYISRIIYGVTSLYGGEIKVYPQYEISGSYGKGPVD
ncbi:crinkler family protein [Gigaspora margarita]|uniref:Crinkler family protein n=1 Tax=Gigaspora margarita TaxID=4874 RepID=A0A8H4EK58_GIGMA|nr:crinkler family protein [Gigaspora margarita]